MSNTPTEAVASNAELGPLYADRDHAAQGEHYLRHLDAMTREGLHAKSDIAGELAYRDTEIERLRAAVDAERDQLRKVVIAYHEMHQWRKRHECDDPDPTAAQHEAVCRMKLAIAMQKALDYLDEQAEQELCNPLTNSATE